MTAYVKQSLNRGLVSEWLYNLGLVVPSLRFKDCGESGLGWVGLCPNGHETYHAFSCELRICPHCASKRSIEMNNKLAPALAALVDAAPSDFGLKHIILGTNINLLDFMSLKGARRLDSDALNSVRKLTWALRGAVADLFREMLAAGLVLGFGIGIEFGFRAGTLHFHVLALSKYIPQRKLSHEWERHNQNHGSYVWIEAVGREGEDIARAVGYVSKYVTKPLNKREEGVLDDITPNVERMSAWVAENGSESVLAALAYVFKGMRRFQTYGSFYNLDVPPDEAEICAVCGAALDWVRELDLLVDGYGAIPPADLLKTLNPDKFCVASDCPVQLRLFEWRSNDPF